MVGRGPSRVRSPAIFVPKITISYYLLNLALFDILAVLEVPAVPQLLGGTGAGFRHKLLAAV